MCPHPCCRGRRRHPDRFPVMLPKGLLDSATDEELITHLQRPAVGDNGDAVVQAVGELERREQRQKRADLRKSVQRHKRRSKQEEYRLWLETEWTAAEESTRGNMLNKRGRAKGIDPRSLWTANDRTRNAYASEELRAYWNAHPVLSAAEFGQADEHAHRAARSRRESSLYGVY